jgi:hypothetical protein
MLKLITLFLFIGFYTTSNAQNSKLLEGKWIFKEALNKGIDDLGRKTLKSDIINKMTFEFRPNGDFVAFAFGENMNGNWLLSTNSKSIVLNTEKEKYEFIILELTGNRLLLKMGLGEFLMKKL